MLFDEPTNHLDAGAVAALIEALEAYQGAVVVVSHDRRFCDALRCTHVGYVSAGSCVIEERSLRDSDFAEGDRGVRNSDANGARAADEGGAAERLSPEEAKAARKAERQRQKALSTAPKKIAQLEGRIGDAEAELEAIDEQMVAAGSDLGRLAELTVTRERIQQKLEAWYAEWESLEELLSVA